MKLDSNGLPYRKLTEKMENDYTDQPTRYLLSKQREGKAKLNSSGDSKSDAGSLESPDDAILTDDNSGLEDTGEGSSKEAAILRANVDDSVFDNENQVSLDSMMAVAPEYEEGGKKQIIENSELLESSMDKLNIEDEALDTIDNIDSMMAVAPEYEESGKEQIVENAELLESSMEKLNIEDEALDTIDNIDFPLVNTRALSKKATTYELENFEKNALIIFNHKEIDGLQDRLGSEKDVDALTSTFQNFGFEVTPHHNLTKDVLFEELEKFSKRNFTDYGCVAVAILTHGYKNGMLRAKDQLYSEIKVINLFKDYSNPTLVTKPKIIIIQACRGTTNMTGVQVLQPNLRKDHDKEDLEPYTLPRESDLLILHSSYPGRASVRHQLHGSWFIQTLCKKIDTLSSTVDLESIITEIKRDVAIEKKYEEYNLITFEIDVNKQMPVMTSTLIRKLYLKKFGERASEETYVDKSRRRSESRHEVLDAVSSSSMTPVLDQHRPCSCYLEHFTYMKNCLRYFVEQTPDDETARDILGIADTFKDGDDFNTSKDKMCKAISNHLFDKARDCTFYKYLYFYNLQTQSQQSFGNKK